MSLLLRPDPVSEGDTESFSLVYSMSAGVVEQQTWFFNGSQIFLTNSHYSLDQKNLVVHDPTRQDTGQYSVRLTNPFSQADAHLNVTVLCKTGTNHNQPQMMMNQTWKYLLLQTMSLIFLY